MRSKTSYFNATQFKKNLTRFWPLWGGASLIGALVPLYLLMELIDSGFRSHAGRGLEFTQMYYYTVSYAVPVISLIYASLCALAVWSYLFNAKSVGMYHSLPITRKGLFLTNLASGMAMMLIPYAVTGALAAVITLAAGTFEPVGVLVTILSVLGESLFYFATASFVVFVTGNPFAFAAFYYIFHFFAVGAEMLLSELMTQFYFGVEGAYQGVSEFLSPTVFFVKNLGVYTQYEQIKTADGWTERGNIELVRLENWWMIALYAAVGIALFVCAWLLYRRRRSESAGEVVAVGWMKPVFRYGVALCSALAVGTVLYNLFFDSFQDGNTANAPLMALCMVLAGILGYYIASMLLAKAVKVFHGSLRGVLVTAAAAAVICFAIAADPFGFERWVPQDASSVVLNLYTPYGRNIYLNETKDPEVMEKVLALHRTIVEERDVLNRRGSAWRSGGGDWEGYSYYVDLSYYEPSGKYVSRTYSIPISKTARQQLKSVQVLEDTVTDPVIQNFNLFADVDPNLSDRTLDANLISGSADGMIWNTQTQAFENMDLTREQARTLEAAVKRDIQARHFGKTAFLPDYDEYEKAVYLGELYLNYNVVRWVNDSRNASYSSTRPTAVYFSISTYCTETIKALTDMGILDAAHKLLTQTEYNNWQQMRDQARDDVDYGEDLYEDPYEYPDDVVYPNGHTVYAAGVIG